MRSATEPTRSWVESGFSPGESEGARVECAIGGCRCLVSVRSTRQNRLPELVIQGFKRLDFCGHAAHAALLLPWGFISVDGHSKVLCVLGGSWRDIASHSVITDFLQKNHDK